MMNDNYNEFKEVAIDNLKNFMVLEILKRLQIDNDPRAIEY